MAWREVGVQVLESQGRLARAGGAAIAFVEELCAYVSDAHRDVAGLLLRDRQDKDYGYVILRRAPDGAFHAVRPKSSIETRDGAAAELLVELEDEVKHPTDVSEFHPGGK
jgi:hypothetical protein